MNVGTACTAFFCSHDGDLKGLCHGDDFCVVARQKQLQTFGKVLEKRFEEHRSRIPRNSRQRSRLCTAVW